MLPGRKHEINGACSELAAGDRREQLVLARSIAPAVPRPQLRDEVGLKPVRPAFQGAVDLMLLQGLIATEPLLRNGKIRKRAELPTRPSVGFGVDFHAPSARFLDLGRRHFGRPDLADRIVLQVAALAVAREGLAILPGQQRDDGRWILRNDLGLQLDPFRTEVDIVVPRQDLDRGVDLVELFRRNAHATDPLRDPMAAFFVAPPLLRQLAIVESLDEQNIAANLRELGHGVAYELA